GAADGVGHAIPLAQLAGGQDQVPRIAILGRLDPFLVGAAAVGVVAAPVLVEAVLLVEVVQRVVVRGGRGLAQRRIVVVRGRAVARDGALLGRDLLVPGRVGEVGTLVGGDLDGKDLGQGGELVGDIHLDQERTVGAARRWGDGQELPAVDRAKRGGETGKRRR